MLKKKWWLLALILIAGAVFASTVMGIVGKIPVLGDRFKKMNTDNKNSASQPVAGDKKV